MSIVVSHDGKTCIYCREDSAGSTSRAHVYPQCILKNDLVLPAGVECDGCNHYHGKLEQELLHHNRIGAPAILCGLPGKRGRRRRGLGFIDVDAAGNIKLRYVAKTARITDKGIEVEYPDLVPLNMDRFRRALCHIALNYVAYEAGAAIALESRFDAVRQYIRRGVGKPWPYVQFMHPDQPLRSELGCRRFRAEINSIVQIRTYVDDFYIDLDSRGDFLTRWATRTLPRGWHLQ